MAPPFSTAPPSCCITLFVSIYFFISVPLFPLRELQSLVDWGIYGPALQTPATYVIFI
jgi:hypothetical protein